MFKNINSINDLLKLIKKEEVKHNKEDVVILDAKAAKKISTINKYTLEEKQKAEYDEYMSKTCKDIYDKIENKALSGENHMSIIFELYEGINEGCLQEYTIETIMRNIGNELECYGYVVSIAVREITKHKEYAFMRVGW